MPVAFGVFAWGLCLGISADFFTYAAALRDYELFCFREASIFQRYDCL